ncbi:MAG: S8 family serine peptidase [Holophagales bacterium]|jgi:subtilisin family serine protease|nr:S8 family serine peptidase [Holophagales bacterium]
MNLYSLKKFAAAFVALFTLGIMGCSTANPQGDANGQSAKDMPAISAPVVKYSFYEPKDEESLKKDTRYGYLIAKTKPGINIALFEKLGLYVVGRISANGANYYYLYREDDVLGALKNLKKASGVIYAEPDGLQQLHTVDANPIEFDDPDPYVSHRLQWGAYVSKAYDAWVQYGFGPHKPVVAAVDTGVQYNHEDLSAVVKHAWSWFEEWGWDYHWDVDQSDLYNNVSLPDIKEIYPDNMGDDFQGHGTHVAGTIAASGNNGLGVAGMCWNVDFISYQGFGANIASDWALYGSFWHLSEWKKARGYSGVIPVNASWGSLYANHFGIDMIEYALQNNVMVIASSGNDSQRLHAYPASYQGVMAVGASDGYDKRAFFSNWGNHLSVVAPGHNIVSTYGMAWSFFTTAEDIYDYQTGYASMSGTSMAAPHVTGLAAYTLSFNPDLKPDQIKTYIETCADYIDGQTGFSEETGWGRINVLKTIEAVINDAETGSAPPSNYVHAPVVVRVFNDDGTNKTPMDGWPVYLYNCDASGKIVNYAASGITGPSDLLRDKDGNLLEGAAYFNLLRPGYYVAAVPTDIASFFGNETETNVTPVFQVIKGSTVETMDIAFNKKVFSIQTYPTSEASRPLEYRPDLVVTLYDSATGEPVFIQDTGGFETLSGLMPPPGAYWIQVQPYRWDLFGDISYDGGDYALCVTSGGALQPAPAPGSWLNRPAGVTEGSLTQTRSDNSQLISFDEVIYGYADPAPLHVIKGNAATGDFYRIVITN